MLPLKCLCFLLQMGQELTTVEYLIMTVGIFRAKERLIGVEILVLLQTSYA